jgi:hypothetical protein
MGYEDNIKMGHGEIVVRRAGLNCFIIVFNDGLAYYQCASIMQERDRTLC